MAGGTPTLRVADQIIVATSRVLGMPVVTADQRIIQFGDVEAIW